MQSQSSSTEREDGRGNRYSSSQLDTAFYNTYLPPTLPTTDYLTSTSASSSSSSYPTWTPLKGDDMLEPPKTDEDLAPTSGTSDFVKKLYKMLTDQTFETIVAWAPRGDCFVVKDPHEFTKSILPRLFKHANFASFVRQLNKYGFHKVKNTEGEFGDEAWVFRHPDFHANQRATLENIKRKVPAARKTHTTPPMSARPLPSPTPPNSSLQSEVERLTHAQDELSAHIRNLERNYHDVLVEMVGFQRNMAQQDGLMQSLIQYFIQLENSGSIQGAPPPPTRDWTAALNANAGGKFSL